jgi:hypothetical protein
MERSMTGRHDHGCEIIALVVLTALSALSHFWYLMIAICAVMALAGVGSLVSGIFLRAQRELLASLVNPARPSEYDGEENSIG